MKKQKKQNERKKERKIEGKKQEDEWKKGINIKRTSSRKHQSSDEVYVKSRESQKSRKCKI